LWDVEVVKKQWDTAHCSLYSCFMRKLDPCNIELACLKKKKRRKLIWAICDFPVWHIS